MSSQHHSMLGACLRALTAGLLGAAMMSGAALAADGKASGAEARYKKQVDYCNSGQSQQDKATCLREAGAARQEARRGQLADSPSTSYDANALARCNAQPAADRDACVARIKGDGSAQGSVRGGGIIRETVTPIPAPAAK